MNKLSENRSGVMKWRAKRFSLIAEKLANSAESKLEKAKSWVQF